MRHKITAMIAAGAVALAAVLYFEKPRAVSAADVIRNLVGACQYLASPATLSDGQQIALGCDASGNLKVSINGSSSGTAVATKPQAAALSYTGNSVGTTSGQILASAARTAFVDVINNSPTATICLGFGVTPTISGSTCGSANVTIPPLGHRSWEGSFVPTNTINAISSAAATPVAVAGL